MSAKVMEVRLDFGGLGTAAQAMDQAARNTENATRATERLAKAAKDPAFLTGPNQRLQRIAADRQRAATLEDPGRKAAVLADLDILEFRTKRSKSLGEKRLSQGQGAIDAPGLLDLFQELNTLMRGLRTGDLLGVGRSLLKGIDHIQEDRGGLNIQQKTAGKGGPSLGDFAGLGLQVGKTETGLAEAAGGAEAAGSGLLALNPVTLGVTAALLVLTAEIALGVAILKGTWDAAEKAGKRFSELEAAAVISGGSTGDIAALRQLGLGPGAVGGASAALRQRLSIGSGSAFDYRAAGRYGVGPQLPRELGGPDNEAAIIRKILEGMSEQFERDPEGVRRDARQLGLEGFLPAMDVSPGTRDRRKRDRTLEESLATDGRAANDFNAALARIPDLFDLVTSAIGGPAMEPITKGAQAIGDSLAHLGEVLQRHPEIGQFVGTLIQGLEEWVAKGIDLVATGIGLFDQTHEAWIRFLKGFYKAFQTIFNAATGPIGPKLPDLPANFGKHTTAHVNALNKNTQAIIDWQAAIKQAVGGGPRAANAIPTAIKGEALRQQMEAAQLVYGGLGAFAN